jgi:hypothetical protein
MTGVIVAPRRSVVAEDICDLQGKPCHTPVALRGVVIQILQRAFHLLQALGRDLASDNEVNHFTGTQSCAIGYT